MYKFQKTLTSSQYFEETRICRENTWRSITKSAPRKASEQDGSSWFSAFGGPSAHGQIGTTSEDRQFPFAISRSVGEEERARMFP